MYDYYFVNIRTHLHDFEGSDFCWITAPGSQIQTRTSVKTLCGVSQIYSLSPGGFPFTSQKHDSRWIGFAKLPQGTIECMVMDWHPMKGVLTS